MLKVNAIRVRRYIFINKFTYFNFLFRKSSLKIKQIFFYTIKTEAILFITPLDQLRVCVQFHVGGKNISIYMHKYRRIILCKRIKIE